MWQVYQTDDAAQSAGLVDEQVYNREPRRIVSTDFDVEHEWDAWSDVHVTPERLFKFVADVQPVVGDEIHAVHVGPRSIPTILRVREVYAFCGFGAQDLRLVSGISLAVAVIDVGIE